jgi:carboxynorspermidine decarboxylase
MICGKSCLAGDIFGDLPLRRSRCASATGISIGDAAGYTMVKKNWFNGVRMPAIAMRELDGRIMPVRSAILVRRLRRQPVLRPPHEERVSNPE